MVDDYTLSTEVARPEIASVQDLLSILQPMTGDRRELWYRGHRDYTWLLEASVFRDENHRTNEQAMLARFRQEAAVTGLPYAFDGWGWITFAQHHQLPTRLLDWSPNPLVALFFACEVGREFLDDEVESDGEFFVLNPTALNREAGDSDGGHPRLLTDADSKLKDFLPGGDASARWKPRAVVAPLLFDRIRFQTGTFTVAQAPSGPAEAKELRESSSLESFVVPGNSKRELREQLDSLGFNEASIYRDLDRIATRIKSLLGRSVS